MATSREIFEKDSSKNLRVHAIHKIENRVSGETTEIIATINFDFEAGVTYASLFIEDTPQAVPAIAHYLDHPQDVSKVGSGIETAMGFHGTDEKISSADLRGSLSRES